MINEFKTWVKKEIEANYKLYLECQHEYDADHYQGRLSQCERLEKFIEEVEDKYKDDLK